MEFLFHLVFGIFFSGRRNFESTSSSYLVSQDAEAALCVRCGAVLRGVRPGEMDSAVALSLVGARLSLGSVAFIGWAGPRGLASIVYTVLIAEATGVPGAELVFVVAAWTILLSIYLHGLSAASLSERYARHTTRRHHSAPEHRETTELPVCLPARRETSR